MKALTLVLASALLPLATSAQLPTRCERAQGTSAYPIETTAGYNHDRFGTMPQDLFREFGAFVSSFDSNDDDDGDGTNDIHAIPEWVAYEIKPFFQNADGSFAPVVGPVGRPNPWYEHPDLAFVVNQPGVTSTRIADSYLGVGNTFNRGHLTMRSHANRIGWRQGCNTHFFLNAVPQRANFNQGIWRDLENITAAWANKFGGVWVIIGPIIDPTQAVQAIGDQGEAPVTVPDALFKIVARNDPDDELPQVLAFIYPQQDPSYGSNQCNPPYPHEQFLVTLREVEDATGLEFFTNLGLTGIAEDNFLDARPAALWPVAAEFFGISC